MEFPSFDEILEAINPKSLEGKRDLRGMAADNLSLALSIMTAQLSAYSYARQQLSLGADPDHVEKLAKEILRLMVNTWYKSTEFATDLYIEAAKVHGDKLGRQVIPPEELKAAFKASCKALMKALAPKIFDLRTVITALPELAETIENGPEDGESWAQGF